MDRTRHNGWAIASTILAVILLVVVIGQQMRLSSLSEKYQRLRADRDYWMSRTDSLMDASIERLTESSQKIENDMNEMIRTGAVK